ncbi:hypothetical protein K493DRAFT_59377 [Basidiobolus meristosporus CBS 931.73]|uniref:Uncharacterized protein n=1 Tax=Basidiobolus meristosporus CBS 931.73 TaxID=1314790 RepID=A0A1Y1XXH9_9FUNG|nr:hypothetical protein K493DRAFT_59377 [Basidiobolus meristosporus CBS 931.73]|eukprot:ORX90447.1 hypothetical protein K493DRAFT_59377 [Basidiobolus meristosporus CBS 931.73]
MSSYTPKYEALHEEYSQLKKKIMPVNRYHCSLKLGCPLPEYICQNNGFCFPRDPEDADCNGHKHLFVRINDVYTFFCKIPDNIEKQVEGPQECEKWEKYRDGLCYFSGVQEEVPDAVEPFFWLLFVGIIAAVMLFVYKRNSTIEEDVNERLPINSSTNYTRVN